MSPAWSYLLHSLQLASLREGSDYLNNFDTSCQKTNYATCVLYPDPQANYTLSGTVNFSQVDDCGTLQELEVKLKIYGFPSTSASTKHGIHIHTYGDLSEGCTSAGGHFNPFSTVHGNISDPADRRHVGDFGNIVVENGEVVTSFTDPIASLVDVDQRASVIGRAVVVHAGEDDLGRGGNAGSVANGNAGPRLACCVIGHSAEPK